MYLQKILDTSGAGGYLHTGEFAAAILWFCSVPGKEKRNGTEIETWLKEPGEVVTEEEKDSKDCQEGGDDGRITFGYRPCARCCASRGHTRHR